MIHTEWDALFLRILGTSCPKNHIKKHKQKITAVEKNMYLVLNEDSEKQFYSNNKWTANKKIF
jgi:hypothetical protein